MSGFISDLRYTIRALRKNPAFTLVATLVLALAIGANAAVFSVVDKVIVRPLSIANADRVVVIWPRERVNPTTIGEISHWTFRLWQREARSFETLAAFGSVNWSLVLREDGEATKLPVAAVSASFFPLVRTPPALGRTLLPEDDRRGAANVVVLSHRTWTQRFGAHPSVVGRRLMLDGRGYTVVGVMPPDFDYPRGAELWVPVVSELVEASTPNLDTLEAPWFGVLFVLGRLGEGVTLEQARTEVTTLIERNAGDAFGPGMEAVLTPVREHIFGKTRPSLLALTVSVGLVLLIACANIATLLVVRSSRHSHETAVRVALGASRWRVVRQSVTDAFVLSVLGGISGLLLGRWMMNALVALAPGDVPRLDLVRFDSRTVIFAWVVCLATAILAGIGPGLHLSHANLAESLKAGSARLTRARRLRRGFVVAQVAVSLLLLVGAGLVARSFVNLLRLDLGYDPANVLTLDVELPDAPAQRRTEFYKALLERIRALPGVEATGAIFLRPLEHTAIGTDATILLEGQRVENRDWQKNPGANYETITPDYFRAMRMRVLRGRAFTEQDTERAPQVVIVSENLAARLWPGEDPIGKRLLRPGAPKDANGEPQWSTVVGVVQNALYRGLTDIRYDLYVPYLQNPDRVKHLMVRTSSDPLALASTIRAEVRSLEPTALVEGVRTMDAIVGHAMAPWRFSAWTLALLSLLALTLSMVGMYGVVSQMIVERTREIAVRTALGACSRDIIVLVLREGLILTLLGMVLGLALAAGGSRLLSGLLFGIPSVDPITFVAVPALAILTTLIAIVLPARRAARVDPLVALRYE